VLVNSAYHSLFGSENVPEIAGEFYRRTRTYLGAGRRGHSIPGNAELCATICELARLLAINAARTKMLVGQCG